MFQFHAANPFRPTNWRWERARLYREKKLRNFKKQNEDIWTIDATKFQISLFKCKEDYDRWRMMELYPDIYSAYLIYRRGDDEDRHPMRYAIEARILAGQHYSEISGKLGISPRVIEYYEKLFFNVIEKLDFPDYIMTCVIGPSVQSGLSDRDFDLLWKLFGYLYGPAVLDTFITTTSRRFKPENLNEVDVTLSEDARSSIQRKVAIVARTFTINPFSQTELLNLYARLLELEKESSGSKAHDVILQNVQIMLDKLPFSIADADNVNELDNMAAELSSNELLELANSNKRLEYSEELSTIKFPEIKENDQKVK